VFCVHSIVYLFSIDGEAAGIGIPVAFVNFYVLHKSHVYLILGTMHPTMLHTPKMPQSLCSRSNYVLWFTFIDLGLLFLLLRLHNLHGC
jgi:hypothetical protein